MNEEISESAKAIKEVAKTSGKALDVGEKFCGFISKHIDGSLQQACGIFEDKLKYMRWENQMKLMLKYQEFLKLHGFEKTPIKPLPLKLAIPLLQAASLEDDDYLQDLWAKLLVNSVAENSGFDLKRMYIDILEKLTSFDVRILERIYSIPFQEALHFGVLTGYLPEDTEVCGRNKEAKKEPSEEVKLSLLNLARLDCIFISRSWGGSQILTRVTHTLLGQKFIEACTLKTFK